MPFEIVFIKRVIFKDWLGSITKIYEVGDICKAHGPVGHPASQYFVTGMGGIYLTEAHRV